ncbi:hypothetical protein CLM62_25170 [Streptomyces sp. SA15]|uniref:hypothetical protein n=1 Tax=Streptomyces sp. SA15 TaxID=934019 RepID=UPI000BAFF71B|nr:hypothetical protein [Streptomyces sp. SA15]PAZ13198.1 hypothetical protein CLM62_25170 [Streptomyces sp. SA15]
MKAPAVRGLPRTVLRLHRTAGIVWVAFVPAAIGCLVWLNLATADSVRATLTGCHRVEGFCPDRCGTARLAWTQ